MQAQPAALQGEVRPVANMGDAREDDSTPSIAVRSWSRIWHGSGAGRAISSSPHRGKPVAGPALPRVKRAHMPGTRLCRASLIGNSNGLDAVELSVFCP